MGLAPLTIASPAPGRSLLGAVEATPPGVSLPESFSGAWRLAGGLERPRPGFDLLSDRDAAPDSERYLPLHLLGRGASSAVWLVRDVVLERDVAMKILTGDGGAEPRRRARFLYEARVAGAVQVPGCIAIHDAGILPDGRCFFTMQHIDGPTLAEAIEARAARRYDALGLRTLLRALARVARVVAGAHAQGLCHRDLKPANMLIAPGGEGHLCDWGLAGPASGGQASGESDLRGAQGLALSGTLNYMAPEQFDGEGAHLGPVSDVYSLGVCLFEVLTGQVPHSGATALSVMFQIRNVDAPDPRAVAPHAAIAPELAELCLAALVREPARRLVTAAHFAERLERRLFP